MCLCFMDLLEYHEISHCDIDFFSSHHRLERISLRRLGQPKAFGQS